MDRRDEIVRAATAATFDRPLITNIFRGVIAEAIVAAALPTWKWVSADYSPFDFLHPSGTRLEVKQSALRQSWSTGKASVPSWDIAERKGTYSDEGGAWVPRVGRNAEIYVLALHDNAGESADHRDPDQWTFHVVAAVALPATKRIGLAAAVRLAGKSVRFGNLHAQVEVVRAGLAAAGDASVAGR